MSVQKTKVYSNLIFLTKCKLQIYCLMVMVPLMHFYGVNRVTRKGGLGQFDTLHILFNLIRSPPKMKLSGYLFHWLKGVSSLNNDQTGVYCSVFPKGGRSTGPPGSNRKKPGYGESILFTRYIKKGLVCTFQVGFKPALPGLPRNLLLYQASNLLEGKTARSGFKPGSRFLKKNYCIIVCAFYNGIHQIFLNQF
jgi:hypothetical protein